VCVAARLLLVVEVYDRNKASCLGLQSVSVRIIASVMPDFVSARRNASAIFYDAHLRGQVTQVGFRMVLLIAAVLSKLVDRPGHQINSPG